MWDTLWELLQDFVLIAAAIDYAKKLIGWLTTKKHTTRKRRLK